MTKKSLEVTTLRWLNQLLDVPELVTLPAGEVAVFSGRSPDKETANEDAACVLSIDKDRIILAVADGCGGMNYGDQASRLVIEGFSLDVEQALQRGHGMRSAILDGIEAGNAGVLKRANGAASTLAVAEVREGKVRPYHVGDSQILLVGSHGKIKLQTAAHSPVGYAVEAGMLSEEEAIHHEDRHLVSNVVGTRDCRIEIGSRRKISSRDTLLVASDGVFDNLHVDEVSNIIRKGPLLEAASALVSLISERMSTQIPGHPCKPDDTTFLLFRRAKK